MKQNFPKNQFKICAVVCEYNPFHNGHRYQLDEIKRKSGCDGVLCLMSGNFVQRGEAAILDKHTRAVHAVLAGADCVVELPLPFAAANAETFALGAISLLARIPAVKTLAFGCECGQGADFLNTANLLLAETDEFKRALKEGLDGGESFAKARYNALKSVYPQTDERLFSSPNNILGLEYTKAILRLNANIKILPLQRVGAGYTDEVLKENYSSASALRQALTENEISKIASNVPEFVLRDLPLALKKEDFLLLDGIERYALLTKTGEKIARTPDCSEGLQNRLKSLAKEAFSADQIVREATSKRYTAARIRRILLANALGLTVEETSLAMENPYANVLALNAENASEFLAVLKEGTLPLLVRKGDENALTYTQKQCYELSERADEIYAVLTKKRLNTHAARFIEK